MLNNNALIDFADLQSAFGDISSTKQDYYEDLINGASQIVEQITKRKLKAQDFTETMDGKGGYNIILPEYPVNSVASVHVDTSRTFDTNTLIDSDDYGVYKDRGIIILFGTFVPKEPLIVKVSYNAGMIEIPEDLKIAVIEIVRYLHGRRNGNLIGKKSINLDTGISEVWETTIPLNALQILNRYKRV